MSATRSGQRPGIPDPPQAAGGAAPGSGDRLPGYQDPGGQDASRREPAHQAGDSTWATRRGGLRGRWSLLLALIAGLTLTGAFPPFGFWPLAMVGPALFALAIWRKGIWSTAGLALLTGLAFYVPLLSWLLNVAWYAWAALAVVEALIFAALALALPALLRLRLWPITLAGWWVAQEGLHSRAPFGGFPWGRLVMSQAGAPTAGWAAIGGLPWLTFMLALAGGCVAWLVIVTASTRPATAAPRAHTIRAVRAFAPIPAIPVAVAITFIGLTLAGDLVWHVPAPASAAPARGTGSGTGSGTALVAAIQGDVPHARNLPGLLRATTVTANHAAATRWLAAQVKAGRVPAPQLVIWPENSTDIDPAYYPPTYQLIANAVAAIDRPVLVGAVLDYPRRNAGQLWLPGVGPVQVYLKRQLVPFGEVIPFRSFLLHFTSLPNLQPVNFTPGHKAVVFHVGQIRLGDVICYEIGFDNLVRSEVLAGANLLAVQTNDATFEVDGQLGESLQQLAMTRMQAVATGRAIVVASTTGVSSFVEPDGSVLIHSGTWQRAVLEARVPLVTTLTPADRLGQWPELALITGTVLALAWSLLRPMTRRRSIRSAP